MKKWVQVLQHNQAAKMGKGQNQVDELENKKLGDRLCS